MKKRIYLNFLALILLSAVLLAVSLSAVVYGVTLSREKAAIRDRAVLVADLLDRALPPAAQPYRDYVNHDSGTARITIIAPDGTVLLDNKNIANDMENHIDREEFVAALADGRGESVRYSETLRADTYFYAIRLTDGNVLRVSNTMSKITGVIGDIIPAIVAITVLVLLIATFAAPRLAQGIIRPLEGIDFDGDNTAIYDELIPFVKKIRQQRQEIDEQISALENRAAVIEDITSHMREGLIMLGGDGTVLSANRSVAALFGDAGGKNILGVCRDIEFQQGVKSCLAGTGGEMLLTRDGRTYSVHFDPARIDGGGAVILFFDVTARHEAEKQRREFSANVSHELKTPLTSISAYAELIESGMAKDEDIKGFAARILAQARRLEAIIVDIIRLSEFDEGKIKDEHKEFSLRELALSVACVLGEKAEKKQVAITVNGEDVLLQANRHMIDELLYNLVDNAIKYNREDGSVTIDISAAEGFCKISVGDSGVGIPAIHQPRVFERFYRVDESRDRKTGGTGLGLSIVKHIAEHHGGRVELESAEGQGTTVTCWLRLTG